MHKHINSNMMHILLIWYHLFYLITLNYVYALVCDKYMAHKIGRPLYIPCIQF
jgi:hypothetical protein